jgi:hypothetical protein
MDHASETPALGRHAGLARRDTPWAAVWAGSSATTSGSLVAALEAVVAAGPANEKWTEADEVLCECTAIAGLLQRRGELLLVARACEHRAEAAEKDVIRNGPTRRRRLVHPGVI